MNNLQESILCRYGWISVVLFLAFTYLLRPIVDPDFFWHLQHGQWLWEHGSLPAGDPFALSSPNVVTPRQHYILTSYWLAQWFYYGIYKFSGWNGFFLLRDILLLVMVWALMARIHAARLVHALLSASLIAVIFARFPVERPQFFSIVAFAVLLALLDRLLYREGRDVPSAVGIPLLMLVWANLHGGVLLGQILCLFSLATVALADSSCRGAIRGKVIVLVGAMLLSLCSPTGFNHLTVMVEASGEQFRDLYAGIAEYDHLGTALLNRNIWVYLLFPLLAILAFCRHFQVGVRKNAPHLLLLAAFTVAACGSVRYLPFLGILSLSPAADVLASCNRRWLLPALLTVFILCVLASPRNLLNFRPLRDGGPVSSVYPQGAVEFIRQQGLHGQVLNNFIWGGYLRFMLGPGHEMLVDGRTLDIERFRDYNRLLGLSGGMENLGIFKAILDKYRIDYVVLPKSYNGQPLWMNWALSRLPGWRPGYDDGQAVVYRRG